MINRLIRVFVILISAALLLPSLIVTPVTYVLFNFNLVEAVSVTFANAIFSDEWEVDDIIRCIK